MDDYNADVSMIHSNAIKVFLEANPNAGPHQFFYESLFSARLAFGSEKLMLL